MPMYPYGQGIKQLLNPDVALPPVYPPKTPPAIKSREYDPQVPSESWQRQFAEPQDQVQSGIAGAPTVHGTAAYGGPRLDTEGALAGLRGLSDSPQHTLASTSGSQLGTPAGGSAYDRGLESTPGTADLYRMAARDPKTVVPGSNQYWGDMLKQRVGDETWETEQQQKEQAAIRGGLAAQHPAIQGAAEAEAMRHAYPQQALGEGDAAAAQYNAQARQMAAEMGLTEAEMKSGTDITTEALRGLSGAQNVQGSDPETVKQWQALVDMARRRRFMSQVGGR